MSKPKKRTRQEIDDVRQKYIELYATIPEDIKRYVTDNLFYLNALDGDASNKASENMRYSYSDIADKCISSVQTVYSWFSYSDSKTAKKKKKPSSLPKLWHAVLLARLFNVDVDYLITDHSDQLFRGKKETTYYDMFVEYLGISKRIFSDGSPYRFINNESAAAHYIMDPILNYLVWSYYDQKRQEAEGQRFPEVLEKWLKKISIDFRIPYHKDIPYSEIDILVNDEKKRHDSPYASFLSAARLLDQKHDDIMKNLEEDDYFIRQKNDDEIDAETRYMRLHNASYERIDASKDDNLANEGDSHKQDIVSDPLSDTNSSSTSADTPEHDNSSSDQTTPAFGKGMGDITDDDLF